jgi:hypothetical protein
MCSATKALPNPAPRITPATSGPTAEKPVCRAVKSPSVVPTSPDGARLAVSGLRIGAYIVSPTAKTPKLDTNSTDARPGWKDATASTSQAAVQMTPTTMSRAGPPRRAVRRTTSICRTMMTAQFTAAARPIVVSLTLRTSSA